MSPTFNCINRTRLHDVLLPFESEKVKSWLALCPGLALESRPSVREKLFSGTMSGQISPTSDSGMPCSRHVSHTQQYREDHIVVLVLCFVPSCYQQRNIFCAAFPVLCCSKFCLIIQFSVTRHQRVCEKVDWRHVLC